MLAFFFRRICFVTLIVSLLFCVETINAQPTQIFQPLQKPVANKFFLPASPAFLSMPAIDSAKILLPKNTLPLNFYSSHLGVACKMELQLEKQIKLPLRIRLGSKDQVDYLEGKYNRHR